MMENKALHLKVITPTGTTLDTVADSVRLPAADGSLGIRKGHATALILLKKGEIRYIADGETKAYRLESEAFASVKNDVVTVITK